MARNTGHDSCAYTHTSKALSIKLSDQIEHLDQLIGADDDGHAFFESTHLTQDILNLVSEGIARLASASSQTVFHLKQAMGGGKTHLLVGLALLAKHPALRRRYCAGISHIDAFECVTIAAFNGRNHPDHFFWGEIAHQLGKADAFNRFWTAGPNAPDEKGWLRLLDDERPVLILLDELPRTSTTSPSPYARSSRRACSPCKVKSPPTRPARTSRA